MRRSRRPISPQRASRGWRSTGLVKPTSISVPVVSEDADRRLLLDSRSVAELLGLGRTKVFQMMASGELPVIRIGRCVRVPRSALESWVAAQTEHSEIGDRRLPIARWGASRS
jgi:excisionase family DNA binding protein